MKFKEEDFIPPCGCRAVGECTHGIWAWKKALEACVDAFAAEMKRKLIKKATEGYSGWDDPDWTEEEIIAALTAHIPKGDMTDIANFAMFFWNRQK